MEQSGIPELHFVSMGMVVLDEIHFPHRSSLNDVPGGSGAYATLGAKIAAGARESKSISCVILTGDDFPDAVLETFHSWKLSLRTHAVDGQKSTRGLLEYHDVDFGRKSFRYLTPPLQPTAHHLEAAGLLHSSAFHILARPEDLEQHVQELLAARQRHGIAQRPLLVWEPAPPHCKNENLEAHLRACEQVDVFSPNHLELMALFGRSPDSSGTMDREIIEKSASRFLSASLKDSDIGNCIVIRAGEYGSLVMSKTEGPHWLLPYYDASSPKIVDPTGAGNAFLGAFTLALQKAGSLREAAIHGSVAAGFALEQVGLPVLESREGVEVWNGEEFQRRLEGYRAIVS